VRVGNLNRRLQVSLRQVGEKVISLGDISSMEPRIVERTSREGVFHVECFTVGNASVECLWMISWCIQSEEGVEHLRIVLQTLQVRKLYAKLLKCEFWLREVSCIRHGIASSGNVVDLPKVDVVLQWKTLKSVTKIRILLGLAGYYQRLIEGYSKMSLSGVLLQDG
ncbi:retrotransposon protein, partial [Trifolium medium]|nr:retrotransposon protein [Trifolium medium]